MPDQDSCPEFAELHRLIRHKADADGGPEHYHVPEILVGGSSPRRLVDVGSPCRFFLRILDAIWENRHSPSPEQGQQLGPDDHVYLAFPRTFASLNGQIGTALTQMMFLPYLRTELGVTVFVSLPTGVIGSVGRKGLRGSPFAVRDPFGIDASFADPLVPELGAIRQYQALVQASLLLGMRPGSIVPLATLSIDSPLFASDPQLGFWREAAPEEPLQWADPQGSRTDPGTYPWREISADSARRFTAPPDASDVCTTSINGQQYYVGQVWRDGIQRSLTLAPAFPGRQDVGGTLSWDDVSMLNFTSLPYPLPAGCYTPGLHDPSKPAWALAAAMIAWRHLVLREEVFFVDVSGTIPDAVFWMARQLSRRDPGSPAPRITFVGEQVWKFDRFTDAIDAVVGPLIFCVSAHTGNIPLLAESMNYHLDAIAQRADSNPYMGGVANHDTLPPLPDLSPLLYTCYHFLPQAVPFTYAGNEFHAQTITNKEFGFDTSAELLRLRASLSNETLALFNDIPLDWEALPERDGRGRRVIDIAELLRRCRSLSHTARLLGLDGYDVVRLPGMGRCSGYRRFSSQNPRDSIVVLVNWDRDRDCQVGWSLAPAVRALGVNTGAARRCVGTGELLSMPPCSAAVWATGVVPRSLPPASAHGQCHGDLS
ncbi:MAG TPA: hypothetical protein VMV17_19045 [Streptosporangiaceae bacterium]|nr:hypothetical protein [Streptosporangiaceae bacterium]